MHVLHPLAKKQAAQPMTAGSTQKATSTASKVSNEQQQPMRKQAVRGSTHVMRNSRDVTSEE